MSVYSVLRIGLLVTVSLVWGCHPAVKQRELQSNGPLELTWTGYDGVNQCDPCEAVYILNGSAIGKGEEGVNALIDRIAELPKGRELLVYPDKWVLSGLVGGEGGPLRPATSEQVTMPGDKEPDSVPFRKTPTAYQRIREAAKARSITIWYLGGAPGEYMLGTKDLRVQEDDEGVWGSP